MLKLFSGSAAIRVSGAAAQLLLTLVISRLCGPSEAGIYFFGYSILIIVSTLVRLGSELSGLRAVAHLFESGDAQGVKRVVDSRVVLSLGLAALSALLILFAAPAISKLTYGASATPVLVFTAATIPALAIIGLLSEVLKGAQHAWLALGVQNIALPTIAVPVIVTAGTMANPTAALVSALMFGTSWLVAIGAILAWTNVFRHRFGNVGGRPRPSLHEIRQIFRDAPSLVTVSMMSVLMQWVGATLLGFLAPASAVAGYSVAMRISIAVSIVHSAAASVVGPQMSIAYAAGNIARLRQVCHQTGVLIAAITWPALIVMLVFAELCMSIFGDGYIEFSYVLRILLAGQLLAALIGHSGMVLVMSGKYASARLNSTAAGVTLAALGLATIPALGAAGAAIAMAGSVTIGHATGILLVRRELGIWTIPTSRGDLRDLYRRQPMESVSAAVKEARD